MRMVDLPGYGFSKASKQISETYGKLAEQFLNQRTNIKLVIQILDIRHDPTNDDLQMIDFLNSSHLPFILSVNKCDKLSKSQGITRAGKIARMLHIDPDTPFILTSSSTKRGIDEIWDAIDFYCFDKAGHEFNATDL